MNLGFLRQLFALRQSKDPRYPDETRMPMVSRTLSGVNVTPDTALTLPAVWRAVTYLSQTVAALPWHVYRDGDDGADIAYNHPVDWMVWKRPNDEWSSFQFRETMMHWALRYGNGYAEIELRTGSSIPYALHPIHPDRVQPVRDEDDKLAFDVDNGYGGRARIPNRQMFHIRGFGDGPIGVSVMAYAAQSIGWAKAAQLFGAAFFGNNLGVGGVVSVKGGLKQAAADAFETKLNQKFGNGPRNAWRWHVADREVEMKPFNVDPNKGQFIETNKALLSDVARWFGVPPHKLYDLERSTNNNIEHQSLEVVVDSITPWVKRFEDEADYKLFTVQNRLGFYTKINMRGLMRGDMAARVAYYQGMSNLGAYSANRVLELEDENTIGSKGDKHVMQSGFTTLERIGEEPVKTIAAPAPKPAPAPAPSAVLDATELAAQDEIEKMAEVNV